MSRPFRYGEPAVKIEAFVAPSTANRLRAMSEEAGVSLGVVVDGLVAPRLADRRPAPLAAKSAPPQRAHVWKYSEKLGQRLCEACGRPKSAAEGTNCVSMAENPPEEAHLTQKGPK